jgi:hypothetical protein
MACAAAGTAQVMVRSALKLRRSTAYLLYPDGLFMVVSMSWYSCHLALLLRDAARLAARASAFLHVTKPKQPWNGH